MGLITDEQKIELLINGMKTSIDYNSKKRWPVVKLYIPDFYITWLLSELDPKNPDLAFGLCDFQFGISGMTHFRLSKIETIRGCSGCSVLRDEEFKPEKTIVEYAQEASNSEGIII